MCKVRYTVSLIVQSFIFALFLKGNNAYTINALNKELEYITFEEALICVQDEELNPKLRSEYVQLIIGQLMPGR